MSNKTLEEIREMNLQVGSPIEITINRSLDKNKECNYKEQGYFKELRKVNGSIIGGGYRYFHLIYETKSSKESVCGIDDVISVKKLK